MRRVILSIRILINSFYLDFKFKFIQPAHCYTHKYIFKTFLNFEPIPVSITWDELNEKKLVSFRRTEKKKIWSVDFLDLPVDALTALI